MQRAPARNVFIMNTRKLSHNVAMCYKASTNVISWAILEHKQEAFFVLNFIMREPGKR